MNEPNILRVDNSMLSAFRTCTRKGYYRYELGMTLPMTEAPLNFGAAIHAGIAHFLRGHSKDESIAVAFKSMKPQEWREKEWRTPDRMVQVLDKVLDSPMPNPMIAPNGEVVVEADFSLPLLTSMEVELLQPYLKPLGITTIHYEGVIDLIGIDGSRHTVDDWKTCSKLVGDKRKGEAKSVSPKWWDSFRPHGATPMYCWAASQIVNEAIRAVTIRAIGCNATDIVLQNTTFELTPSEIEEARVNVVGQVLNYLRLKNRGELESSFNPDSCMDYGKMCPFINICRVAKESREGLKGMFEIHKWDPLAARKQELAGITE